MTVFFSVVLCVLGCTSVDRLLTVFHIYTCLIAACGTSYYIPRMFNGFNFMNGLFSANGLVGREGTGVLQHSGMRCCIIASSPPGLILRSGMPTNRTDPLPRAVRSSDLDSPSQRTQAGCLPPHRLSIPAACLVCPLPRPSARGCPSDRPTPAGRAPAGIATSSAQTPEKRR